MADTRIEELRRRLERDPASRLFAQLAEELRKGGELAEAIGVARAGLAVHPSYPSARLTLGRALLDSGDAKGARAELESALREAPDNILASRYLAQARAEAGDLPGAADQYRKTLLMAPGDKQLQAALDAVVARQAGPAVAPAVPQAPAPPAVPNAPAGPAAPPAPPVAPASIVAPAPPPRASAPPPAPPPAVAQASPGPVVFTPSRPAQPAPQASAGEDAGGDLPPTLRIHAPQAVAPPAPATPPAPPPPPPRAAAPPAASAPPPSAPPPSAPPPSAPPPPPPVAPAAPPPPSARPLTSPLPEDVPITPEAKTLPGKAVEPAQEPPAAPFPSSTLAELYLQQGLGERAVAVYRQVLELEPDNEKARRRLAELEQGEPTALDRATRRQALERTIAGLELLLATVRRR